MESGFASNGYGDRSPGGYGLLAGLIIEVVLTAVFVYIILGATDDRAPKGFAPIAIGLGLTLIHLVSIPVTNTSVEPGPLARSRLVRRRRRARPGLAVHRRADHRSRHRRRQLRAITGAHRVRSTKASPTTRNALSCEKSASALQARTVKRANCGTRQAVLHQARRTSRTQRISLAQSRSNTVPKEGLEPSHPKAQEPKSCVSTSSTTPAVFDCFAPLRADRALEPPTSSSLDEQDESAVRSFLLSTAARDRGSLRRDSTHSLRPQPVALYNGVPA